MLLELLVENFAVIERVRVRFHPGLNLLTGETGSGKSIVVDALGLLFGGRASADVVRSGTERARISAIFEVSSEPGFRALVDEAGIELEDGELILEREILAVGQVACVCGESPGYGLLAPRPLSLSRRYPRTARSTVALLARGAARDARRLRRDRSNAHRRPATGAGGSVRRNSRIWTGVTRSGCVLPTSGRFRSGEIESAAPASGEDVELENQRRVLKNVAKIEEVAGAAYAALV